MLLMNMEGLLLEILLIFPCFSSGQNNIALNRPTQLSTHLYDGLPWKAVDGDYEANLYLPPGCAYAIGQYILPYTWWAVDLGYEYEISHVMVYRRGGTFVLTGIHLELGSGSPILCGSGAVKTCAVLTTPAGDPYENITCAPGSTGRFLTIRRNDLDGLCLCEVEVYGKLVSASAEADKARNCLGTNKLTKQVDFGLSGDDVSQGESTTRMDCSIECIRKGACVAYSFNPGLNQCQYAIGEFLKLVEVVASVGWDTYTSC